MYLKQDTILAEYEHAFLQSATHSSVVQGHGNLMTEYYDGG
jgi:hypothetical protein